MLKVSMIAAPSRIGIAARSVLGSAMAKACVARVTRRAMTLDYTGLCNYYVTCPSSSYNYTGLCNYYVIR